MRVSERARACVGDDEGEKGRGWVALLQDLVSVRSDGAGVRMG